MLLDNNDIAIFDATNSDKNKRKLLYERTPKDIKILYPQKKYIKKAILVLKIFS